jgi:hypothetical protein
MKKMKQIHISILTIIIIFLSSTQVTVLGQAPEPNTDFENAQIIEVGLTGFYRIRR